jgi:bacillithiol biosynthesis deacetylase BshB1
MTPARTEGPNPGGSPLDLLVFGPHPDDLEIGLGGTIAKHASRGATVGLCDLTAGEMSTNGTIEERLTESDRARAVLGALWRANLRWPDRAIGKDPGHLDEAVSFIRTHRPRTIAVPFWSDRHPDHVVASGLLTEAAFNAGLRRYQPGQAAWRAEWICYYFINNDADPSFVVDVSDHYERKREALDCHSSQFQRDAPGAAGTRLNTPLFRQLIESRDARFGALAGVRWAEGIVVREPLVRQGLFKRD